MGLFFDCIVSDLACLKADLESEIIGKKLDRDFEKSMKELDKIIEQEKAENEKKENENVAGKMYEKENDSLENKETDIPFNDLKSDHKVSGAATAGTIYGDVSNASTLYGMDKFSTPRGHGFAAERANHLYDTLTGHDATIAGDNNAKWGADRIVDGVEIQSKYCKTGSKCISECFENGKLKYMNSNGTPMQIEVPSDKYDAAVQAMETKE